MPTRGQFSTPIDTVASAYALPDNGTATFSEMVDRVRVLAAVSPIPLIADADTGFGGSANLARTIRAYHAAGAAAIQIEDQTFPKIMGHGGTAPSVVTRDEAVERIRVAVAERPSPEMLIVARTDARRGHGLSEALLRGEAFLNAGADLLFIEGPQTESEMAALCKAFHNVPLVINMARGGTTPMTSSRDLEDMGFKLALAPVDALLASAHAMQSVFRDLAQHGIRAEAAHEMMPLGHVARLFS